MTNQDKILNKTDDGLGQQKLNAPVVERVLSVLDSEIENIRDTQTRQGWTSWGLIGGIIGALWLLSEELKVGKLQSEVVGTSILLFSTFIDALRWLIPLLTHRAIRKDESLRFRWSNEFFSGNELLFGFEILRSITLVLVAFFLTTKWWLPLMAAAIAYCWYGVMATLWLILTLMEYPVRKGFTKLGTTYILIFVAACLINLLRDKASTAKFEQRSHQICPSTAN